ncbi:MAG: hypothetical protein O2819_01485 [Planctomycetota bacterium]|nr:hypothetical protein [Planctomycetota bacterium]MDA1105021.1 hypothetical protein [Planctomycetota bacterium]
MPAPEWYANGLRFECSQCRTWPFWTENLASPAAWKLAKAKTPCPGMDGGPIIPIESIRIQRDLDCRDNADKPF